MKTQHFHTKLLSKKPMLRQIEWVVQDGPITKNGGLPLTALFFWKFYSNLTTSYKATSYPNVHIYTFRKYWNFMWRCFFPVILPLDLFCFRWINFFLTLPIPCISESWIRRNINFNFYFHTPFVVPQKVFQSHRTCFVSVLDVINQIWTIVVN